MVYMDDGVYGWNYTYDPEDRLVRVLRDGALRARYWYDAGGRRVKLQEGANTILHVYSELNTVYEVNGSSITKHYYANGLHVAESRSGTLEYYHQDHLGACVFIERGMSWYDDYRILIRLYSIDVNGFEAFETWIPSNGLNWSCVSRGEESY